MVLVVLFYLDLWNHFELLKKVSIVQGCLLRAGFYDNYLYSTIQMITSTWSLKLIKFSASEPSSHQESI